MENEIEKLFNNHSDCYADTWEESDDTIPVTMVEGKVVMAMTLEGFEKAYKAALARGGVGAKWVKATDRMPELKGKRNSVIIKCTDPKKGFVTKGFRNYNDITPALYMVVGNLSFLTTHGEADYRTTIPVQCIEWLDEEPAALPKGNWTDEDLGNAFLAARRSSSEVIGRIKVGGAFSDYYAPEYQTFHQYLQSLKATASKSKSD